MESRLMTKFFDAFISYGRADSKDFAIKLQTSLNKHGFQVWFDFNDIPLGVDFQNQIDDGIEKADNFLFIISPHSINSPYCLKEIELAIKCNKRIIPLLHVEQINREIWQQRNPNGTDEEWELYKAQGKHTSFKNMHPTIGKINWVYFREDKEDFDKSLGDLINLLGSHKDYVKQHTRFLDKALEWERNQKQTSCLLVGEEKQLAQSWLKIRFKEEQPPCVPSDLHCEYITESIKNGNNLMTEVMLSYAEKDRATMEKIRASLRREGITVWTNTTDIQTGEDFVDSIKQGIQKADNLVYLLSDNSIESSYCQRELDLAVYLNKRIIPLLVQKTDNLELPSCLENLQYIDFTDNQFDESELLKILYEDKAYYNEHKILLTKALKWQQQNHNPSILLRGYNLSRAETWLKVAQKRTQHPPIPLQLEFITASLQQPPLDSLDVFISYSRADSDLARKLNDALQLQGKTTWFDQESIASGSDFQHEINQGIEASDNFLFIISPRSVNSPYCNSEVEYAASLNKRFITVLHKEVNTKDLHPELAKVQWIDFNRNQKDFNANFNQLLRTIETDREHLRSHSKWLQKALEWEHKNKNDDLLLRGSNFINAQEWLKETEDKNKKPAITSLQKEFIQASQKAMELAEEEKRRQLEIMHLKEEKRKEAEARLAEQKKIDQIKNKSIVGIIIALLGTVGLLIFALVQKEKAEEAQLTQLNSVSKYSLALSQIGSRFEAIFEAIRAGEQIKKLDKKEKQKETRSSILKALQTAVYEEGFREQNRLEHKNPVRDVAWSRDGNEIVSAIKGGEIKFLNLINSKEIRLKQVETSNKYDYMMFSPDGKKIGFFDKNDNFTILALDKDEEKTKIPKSLGNFKDFWFEVAWSNDGKTIASVSDDHKIKLWDAVEGKFIKAIVDPLDPQEKFTSVSFSGDGKTVASGSLDGKIKLWNVDDGKLIYTIPVDKNPKIDKVSLSPKGKNIAFVSDGDVYLFNLEKKETLSIADNDGYFRSLVWSHNGDTIAYTNKNNTVFLWDTSGKFLQTLIGHDAPITIIKFTPDGKKIATASEDNTVRLWKLSENKLEKFESPNKTNFLSVALNSDGNIIASGSNDNTVKIWTKQGKQKNWEPIPTQIEYNNDVLSLSPDGKIIAFASEKTIKLWNKQENFIKEIGTHNDSVKSIAWSPDGKTIASVSEDNIIKRWNLDGEKLHSFKVEEHGSVLSVALSPDGKTIASGSSDNTIKLWNEKGKDFRTLKGHVNDVLSVAFSPDGKTLASASMDSTVKLWDLDDGEEFQTLNGHKYMGVTNVRFSPDGKTLASTGYDKNLVLWNLDDLTLDKLLEDGCQQVKDYLEFNATGEERELCKFNS